jgi:HEAT repeat protein
MVARASVGRSRQEEPARASARFGGASEAALALSDRAAHHESVRALTDEFPAEESVAALLAALDDPVRLASVEFARYAAYNLLTRLGAPPRSPAFVTRVFRGLEDPAISVRLLCVHFVPRLEVDHHPRVVEALRRELFDPSPTIVASAAASLSQLGRASEPAVEELRGLFRNPAPETRRRWENPPPDDGIATGRLAGTFDGSPEKAIRSAAASALFRIVGIEAVLAELPKLDETGERVAALAALPFCDLVDAPAEALGPDPPPLDRSAETRSRVASLVYRNAGDASLADGDRADLLRATGRITISDRWPLPTRAEGRRLLDAVAGDPSSPRHRSLAREILDAAAAVQAPERGRDG